VMLFSEGFSLPRWDANRYSTRVSATLVENSADRLIEPANRLPWCCSAIDPARLAVPMIEARTMLAG
jgi:hypothetical protein